MEWIDSADQVYPTDVKADQVECDSDYEILDLDQAIPSVSQPHPLAFQDAYTDETDDIDLEPERNKEDRIEDDYSLDKDDFNYDDIVENYEELENEDLYAKEDEAIEYKPKFVIPKQFTKRRPARNLDENLTNVLAHARILKAEKKYAEAIKTCLALIKQAPKSHELYSLLASLYEIIGNNQGAHQFRKLAQMMIPVSREVIEEQLNEALASNDYHSASLLYGKLCRIDKNNVELYRVYIKILAHVRNEKRMLGAQSAMIRAMKAPEFKDEAKVLAINTAYKMMKLNMTLGAKVCLENYVVTHPDGIDESFVHLLTEVYIQLEDYNSILLCLIVKANVRVYQSNGVEVENEEDFPMITDYSIPEDMPVELRSKLCIALIGLGLSDLVQRLEKILIENKENFSEELVEVAVTYKKMGNFSRAIFMLKEAITIEEENTVKNWMLLAECYEGKERIEEAIETYETVIQKDVENMGNRLAFAKFLEKIGKIKEAISIITPDPDNLVIDTNVQYELCLLCERHMKLPSANCKSEYLEEFIRAVHTLFKRHCYQFKSRTEFEGIFSLYRIKSVFVNQRIEKLVIESRDIEFSKPTHTTDDEYQLFLKLYDIFKSLKRYPELERLVFQGFMSTAFNISRYRKDIQAKMIVASYLNKDQQPLFNRARGLLENPDANAAWNFFNLLCSQCPDFRLTRSLVRYTNAHPDNTQAVLLCGNYSLMAGTYKYALSEFFKALKMAPNNPLTLLLIGCTHLHIACQKHSTKKSSLIVQGISFLKAYSDIRSFGQETMYNVGRAYHQIGALHLALHYYRLALKEAPVLRAMDLSREIAANMVVLYKSIGARDLALYYVKKYLTI